MLVVACRARIPCSCSPRRHVSAGQHEGPSAFDARPLGTRIMIVRKRSGTVVAPSSYSLPVRPKLHACSCEVPARSYRRRTAGLVLRLRTVDPADSARLHRCGCCQSCCGTCGCCGLLVRPAASDALGLAVMPCLRSASCTRGCPARRAPALERLANENAKLLVVGVRSLVGGASRRRSRMATPRVRGTACHKQGLPRGNESKPHFLPSRGRPRRSSARGSHCAGPRAPRARGRQPCLAAAAIGTRLFDPSQRRLGQVEVARTYATDLPSSSPSRT